MPGNDDYTDDYVAELLKRDAKATSSAASNLGIGSLLLSKRPTGSAPKPNTRFLNNLIRDTTSHNAALLAKEAEDSRARLRRLREKEGRLRGKPEQQLYSARARHDGSAARPTKRRRLSEDMDEKSRKRERPGDEEEGYARRSGHHAKERRRRDDDNDDDDDDGEDHAHNRSKKHQGRRHEGHRHQRRRSRSPEKEHETEGANQKNHSHRHRSRSRSRHRSSDKRTHRRKYSSSPESLDRRKPSRRERDGKSPSHRPQSSTTRRRQSPESDSDPLEAIVGPAPPSQSTIRSKGRGAFNRNTIDSHFATNYDPSADVTPEVEEQDDWEGALEALRDRQKWRQQGAERLLAAGFSEQEVEKWQNQKINSKGEREMDEADVKWSKAGEGREWDRGKVVDDESGHVELKPEWGRLKGT